MSSIAVLSVHAPLPVFAYTCIEFEEGGNAVLKPPFPPLSSITVTQDGQCGVSIRRDTTIVLLGDMEADPTQPVGEVLKKLHQQFYVESPPLQALANSPFSHGGLTSVQNQFKSPGFSHLTATPSLTNFNGPQLHAPVKPNGGISLLEHSTSSTSSELGKNLTPQENQKLSTTDETAAEQVPKKSKPSFSIDNLLADRMKSIETMISKKHTTPQSNGTSSNGVPTSSGHVMIPQINGVKNDMLINKPVEPTNKQQPMKIESKEIPIKIAKLSDLNYALKPEPTKKQTMAKSAVKLNGIQTTPVAFPPVTVNGKPREVIPTSLETPPTTPPKMAPATPSTQTPPQKHIVATKLEPVITPPVISSNKTLTPPSEPTFKVPSPVDIEKLRKAQWEQQKREAERAHKKNIIWSRTKTDPPIDQFPPKPKRVQPVAKEEKVLPKEEPPVVKPRPPIKDVLGGYSVDTIFLALSQEPRVALYSPKRKSLADLVREKQEELDAAKIVAEESSNTGEDSLFVAQDMKKLEEEVQKDVRDLEPKKPPTSYEQVIQTLTQKPAKRGRPKGSKKSKSGSDTDTESLSEERDEEDYQDEDFDIEKAVREIDDVHNRVKLGRKPRNSNTVSEDGDSPEPSTSQDIRPLKRKVSLDPSPQDPSTAPKQRRSERLKSSTARMDDFFYESAVTVQSEHNESPEPPRVKTVEVEEEPSTSNDQKSRKDRSKTPKSTSRRNSASSADAQSRAPGPSIPKKTRAFARVEQYSRRVSNETVQSLLSQVLIPTAAEDIEILDYFKFPIVRRAIVNRNTLCYAISMVQLLLRVPQVYSIIRSHSHKDNTAERPECFICMLAKIISERPRVDDYPAFIAILRSSWKNMEAEEMHCVMEAMQHFFNKFDEEYMLEHPGYVGQLPTICSPIRSFFEIELILNYKCKSCAHTSSAADKAIYISVDLTRKSDGTMQSMVDSMAFPTAVHGMDCPSCNEETLTSTTHFTKLPEVLLYFVPRVRNKKREKDMTVVNVQKQLVLTDEGNLHKYALCAFLTHCGLTGNKGHYKSFEVDRSGEFHYNEFDDAMVVINSKLSSDITIVLAMFRKEQAVAKDAETDMIFDGRGNIVFAHEKHCKQE